jgi:hypothetical protein
LILDSNIRNSVCTPAKFPCRRVEMGYEKKLIMATQTFQVLYTSLFEMNYNLCKKQVNETVRKKLINLILIKKNTCGHILIGNPAETYFSIHNYL